MAKITKPNALWNTIKPTIAELLKNDEAIKQLTAELATLKRTDAALDEEMRDICQKFWDETNEVKNLHTNATSHFNSLQGQITDSKSTIMTIYGAISGIHSTLKTRQDQQEAANTAHKIAEGATISRHEHLKRVREAIDSYRQGVDAAEGLHADAIIKINELQETLQESQSATEEISKSIEGHLPSLKNLDTKYEKVKNAQEAATLKTSNKDNELTDATETALDVLADEILISDGLRVIKRVLLRSLGKKFGFKKWTCSDPNYNRILWPQVEGILCILVELPLFFSLAELQTLLGYSPHNNNVKLALKKMTEEEMLIVVEDKSLTENYYLGETARAILGRKIIPDISVARPADLVATIQEHFVAGHLQANKYKKRKAKTATPKHTTDTPFATPSPKKKRKLTLEEEATTDSEKKGSTSDNALHISSEEYTSDSDTSDSDNDKSANEVPQDRAEV